MKSAAVRRSVVVGGHKTSICIEDAFWSSLKEIAQAQGASVAQTITEIDRMRQGPNLCSAIRLFVLDRVLSQKVWGHREKHGSPDKRRQLRGVGGAGGLND